MTIFLIHPKPLIPQLLPRVMVIITFTLKTTGLVLQPLLNNQSQKGTMKVQTTTEKQECRPASHWPMCSIRKLYYGQVPMDSHLDDSSDPMPGSKKEV